MNYDLKYENRRVFMEKSSTVKSIRLTNETLTKIEKIIEKTFKKEGKELNTSDVIRYAIDFTFSNQYKVNLDEEDILELMKDYIKVTYFRNSLPYVGAKNIELNKANVTKLEETLYAVEEVYREFEYKEVKELGLLFNEEEPITFVDLLRFEYRLMPETFLKFMGVKEEEYMSLSDKELANFIAKKMKNEEFKSRAIAMFTIDL